ncbi:AraC family transcriptional regulator [Clostridium sp. 19966]|uniref:AraC family transcriptional regulator n=1 Tax=Clostridium sp. 19966 TaxID=2768166 RepID=UPI0028E851EA|nr:AraC family transcriptional regulator [Clostridium sp. 19966]
MRYFLSDASCSLKYVWCGNLISKNNFLHHKRCFDMNVLIMVKEGTLYISQEGVNFQVGPNQYIFLKANEEHFGYRPSEGKLSYLWVHFLINEQVTVMTEETFAVEMLKQREEDSTKNIYIMPEKGEVSFTQRAPLLLNQLLDLSRQEMIYSNQILDYALSFLAMEISQEFIEMQHKSSNSIPYNIARIIDWIKANYYKEITLTDIANEFGYNPDYLSSLLKKTTNHSFKYFINKTRIDSSKSLMMNYDISIKEVAYSCGFSDEKYFMKLFKKIEGIE